MILLRTTGLMLATLIVGCGGSQNAPAAASNDSVATTPTAMAESAASTPKAEAAAKAPEAEAAPSGPECKKAEDCTIFADCCSCKAVPASNPSLVPCDSVCGESKCEVKGITIANVACDTGRCVIKKK